MSIKCCQYGNCLNEIGDAGVSVALRTATFDEEKQAKFCCAAHAAASLLRLAISRKEAPEETAITGNGAPIPNRWKSV